MNFSSFKYLTSQGFKNMVHNRLMSIASIGVLTACLAITGASALLSLNIGNFVDYLCGRDEIVVYVKDIELEKEPEVMSEEEILAANTAFDNRVRDVQAGLNSIANIKQATYVSKMDALNETMNRMGGEFSGLWQGYEGLNNPFPASYRVTVNDLSQMQQTVNDIALIEGVDYSTSQTELTGVLMNLKKGVTVAGAALIAILIIVSLVVISNTIRLTVFARRKEINIMKFVGATNAFIRLPFLIEGMLVGAISAVLSFGIVSLGYVGIINYFSQDSASLINTFYYTMTAYQGVWAYLLFGFLTSGVVVGGVGSALSIRKHLNV